MSTDTTASSSRLPPSGDSPDGMVDSFKSAMDSLKEGRAYFEQYLSAKVDGTKATLRLWALYAVLGVFGLIVALTATVTLTVLLISGLAGGLAVALGGRVWLANLLIGLLFITAVGVGALLVYRMVTGRVRRRTVLKYEAMRRKQQMDFGHHAEDKANGYA